MLKAKKVSMMKKNRVRRKNCLITKLKTQLKQRISKNKMSRTVRRRMQIMIMVKMQKMAAELRQKKRKKMVMRILMMSMTVIMMKRDAISGEQKVKIGSSITRKIKRRMNKVCLQCQNV